MAALSLLDVLADIPDPRSRHGRRHPLGAVLGLVCFAVLLGILPLAGRVVIGDAIFCQRDLAEQVRRQGGDYVLIVKDNQEGLATDIGAGFGYEAAAQSIAAATGAGPAFSP